MAFKPTKEQKNAIHAKGTLLISAAAGSGKTAVLVERVIKHITDKENPMEADRLLVVTFTNAAAAEMRSRIAERLADEVHKDPKNTRLQRQQILLSKANISTMDSFCINLVRENFHTLELSPDFKIADESLLNQLKMIAMDETIDELFKSETEAFRELIEVLGADSGDSNLRDAIARIYNFLRSLPFPKVWMDKVLEGYKNENEIMNSSWVQKIYDYAEGFVRNNLHEFRLIIEEIKLDERVYEAYFDGFSRTKMALEELLELIKSKQWDDIRGFCEGFVSSKCGVLRKYEDEDFKTKVRAAKEKAEKAIWKTGDIFCCTAEDGVLDMKQLRPLVEKLFLLVNIYTDKLMALKTSKKCLDFADVEFAALRLLTENRDGKIVLTSIAKELSSRFDEVLVDEYQDTNDLQDTIFNALSNNGEKIFMVGDVKQSIYRFRQANPANFLKYHDEFKVYDGTSGKSRISLAHNFRSREDICGFVNFLFHLLMTKAVGEMDYTEEEELVAAARFPTEMVDHTEIHIINTGESDDKKEVLEARHIASYIKETMNASAVIKENETKLRKANFRDFTILLRNKSTKAAVYIKELKAAGIPVWGDVTGGFLQAREVSAMLSLLQAINNPLRDIPLLNVLLSPIFGFSADELANIRINNRKGSLFSALNFEKRQSEKIEGALKKLENMRRIAASVPVYQLINRVYEETGYLSLVQVMENGAQRRANLLLLLDYARNFESVGGKGLSSFLRFIEKVGANENSLTAASIVTEADDVVKIMTVHRSKGLQFPICILAGVSSKMNKKDISAPLLLHQTGGIGLMIYDDLARKKYSTIPREALAIEINAATVAEELRVLYVALTRAEDRLIIVAAEKDVTQKLQQLARAEIEPMAVMAAASFSDWILSCLLLHPSGRQLREMAKVDITPKNVNGAVMVRVINGAEIVSESIRVEEANEPTVDDGMLAEIEERLRFVYPYVALSGIAAKMTASKIAAREIEEEYYFKSRPAFLSGERLTAAQKGTAMHIFMEHADFTLAAIDVSAELARLSGEGFLTEAEMSAVDTDKLQKFFESDIYQRISKADRVMKEFKFMVEINASVIDNSLTPEMQEEKIVIQGIADCVFIEENEIVIVDYKTDRVSDIKKLALHYNAQLKVYEMALAEVLEMPVKESVLFSLHLGESIVV